MADTTLSPDVTLAVLEPADMTAETVDLQRYYTLEQLEQMPSEALDELWQACPDKSFYEAALDQAVAGKYGDAALDLDRLEVIAESIELYKVPKVPALKQSNGSIRWFKVPAKVIRYLQDGVPMESAEPAAAKASMPSMTGRIAVAVGMVIGVVVLAIVLLGNTGKPRLTEADMTATALAAAELMITPGETPTPTPLALYDTDRPIKEGDNLGNYYPVTLEIIPSNQREAALVLPVQQKAIDVSVWDFDADPAVASSIYGFVIRPVIGIPYSPNNANFLTNLQPGDQIRLQMNTSQILNFNVSHSGRVDRQDESIFEQTHPGIVITMVGDLAPDRLVIYGDYPVDQESILASASTSGDPVVGMNEATTHGDTGVSISMLEAYTSYGPANAQLASSWTYLLVDMQVNASAAIDTAGFQIELVTSTGTRYVPVNVDSSITHLQPYASTVVGANSEYKATLGFLVPRDLNGATVYIRTSSSAPNVGYRLSYTAPSSLTASNLEVLVLDMKLTSPKNEIPGSVAVTLRLFNPNGQEVSVNPGDIYAIFSPTILEEAFPVGPATQPTDAPLPLVIQPGTAQDITFTFAWNGTDPYMGIAVGGYQFIAALQ
jgi:hypothetical protein